MRKMVLALLSPLVLAAGIPAVTHAHPTGGGSVGSLGDRPTVTVTPPAATVTTTVTTTVATTVPTTVTSVIQAPPEAPTMFAAEFPLGGHYVSWNPLNNQGVECSPAGGQEWCTTKAGYETQSSTSAQFPSPESRRFQPCILGQHPDTLCDYIPVTTGTGAVTFFRVRAWDSFGQAGAWSNIVRVE